MRMLSLKNNNMKQYIDDMHTPNFDDRNDKTDF